MIRRDIKPPKHYIRRMTPLGTAAMWLIAVVDFPAFIVIDDKGNDFFKD
jgi:tartrate dehydratase beta subunit/fumarate hydratase class I family protein